MTGDIVAQNVSFCAEFKLSLKILRFF